MKSVAWPRARVRADLMWRKQKKKPTSPTACVHLMPTVSGGMQMLEACWQLRNAVSQSEAHTSSHLLPSNSLYGNTNLARTEVIRKA